MRRGGRYYKLRAALQTFKQERDQRGYDKPMIEVRHVILPSEKSNEISEFKRYRFQISDTVMFNYLVLIGPMKTGNSRKLRSCRDIRREMYIRCNGKVLLCGCQEHIGIKPEWLVDTHVTSIKEAWHHTRLQEIRRIHENESNFIPEFCKVCV